MFSGNRFRVKGFFASFSVLVVLAGLLFGARVAAADSVWVQSYERSSQTQSCVGQPGETPWQASWGPDASWTKSWEQWANGGKGGWTCTRSITWARTPVAGGTSASTDALGETGPGGGLVFYIDSASGLRYEMAPANWNDPSNPTGVDPAQVWTTTAAFCYADDSSTANADCQRNNLYPGTSSDQAASSTASEAVGMGSANTAAIEARMTAGSVASSAYAAGMAGAYAGGGLTDWFLPSQDELNAMCNYSRNPTAPAAPSVSCRGVGGSSQNVTFASGAYGFGIVDNYWSSSQDAPGYALQQNLGDGGQDATGKNYTSLLVRPVRAF
jgi:hypothetical protein